MERAVAQHAPAVRSRLLPWSPGRVQLCALLRGQLQVHRGEPYSRQLAGRLRQRRFYCGGQRVRVSYWIAPGRRIVMLTVFTAERHNSRQTGYRHDPRSSLSPMMSKSIRRKICT